MKHEKMYLKLSLMDEGDIVELTKCEIPCNYVEYSLLKTKVMTFETEKDKEKIALGIIYATKEATVKQETYLYPFESFIAEFGGALGMFLGFSFIILWDIIEWVLISAKKITQN